MNCHFRISILCLSFPLVVQAHDKRPLAISADENGFQLSETILKYSVEKKNISVGPVTLSPATFKFGALHSIQEPKLLLKIPKLSGAEPEVEFNYGDHFEVLSFHPKDLPLISSLSAREIEDAGSMGFDGQDVVLKPTESFLNFSANKDFRICLTQKKEDLFARYCTPHFTFQKEKPLVLSASKRESQYILIDGKISEPQGQMTVTPAQKMNFYAINQTGYSVDLQLQPISARLEQAYRLEDEQMELITLENCPFPGSCEPSSIHFDLGDSKILKSTRAPLNPYVQVFGKHEIGVFEQKLEIAKVPKKSEQVFIDSEPSRKTYEFMTMVALSAPPQVHLASDDGELLNEPEGKNDVVWGIRTKQIGISHRAVLKQHIEAREYVSGFIVDRAYPRELSGSFAALATKSNTSILAAASYNHWFEHFLTIDSPLTTLRWGISIDHSSTLAPLKSNDGSSEYDLRDLSADIEYRWQPGLANRDRSWGLMAGYRDLDYANYTIAMLGAGAFGSFPLPQTIDEILNRLAFLEAPKWIEIELIYFPTSLDSNFSLASTYTFKSKCKISWKENFFGELGFGVKNFDFENTSGGGAKLTASFATLGMGIRF